MTTRRKEYIPARVDELAGQKQNLVDVLALIADIHRKISRLLSEPEVMNKETEKGHPLYNLKMAMYWLRKIEAIRN